MAKLQLDLSSELEEEIQQLFIKSAREVFNEMSKQSLNTRDYLNLTDACEYLNISYGTLSMWIRDYGLKISRIGGKKFISKDELVSFMARHEE